MRLVKEHLPEPVAFIDRLMFLLYLLKDTLDTCKYSYLFFECGIVRVVKAVKGIVNPQTHTCAAEDPHESFCNELEQIVQVFHKHQVQTVCHHHVKVVCEVLGRGKLLSKKTDFVHLFHLLRLVNDHCREL